jgi:hypothetical protein
MEPRLSLFVLETTAWDEIYVAATSHSQALDLAPPEAEIATVRPLFREEAEGIKDDRESLWAFYLRQTTPAFLGWMET